MPKKNLSAFCSDMLDEYLENEGKLIDERASSFSQPPAEPLTYELPTRGASYVRTLDSVLKKQTNGSPASDLISGFIPPSKRSKVTLRETKMSRREATRQKGPRHHRTQAEPAAAPGPADSNPVLNQPAVHIPDSVAAQPPTLKRRRKLKPKTSSQTLSPHRTTTPPPSTVEEMALLQSTPVRRAADDKSVDGFRMDEGPVMTRALLKQKDLEDGVVLEGRPKTSVTEERASVALTSLFTLMVRAHSCHTHQPDVSERPCLTGNVKIKCSE